MPKKFGTNTKAAEANARKDAVKQANEREKQQKLEDEYWRDDDKHVQKKQQRKDDREQKDHEKLQRKLENQVLLEKEEATSSASKSKKNADLAPKKVTQAQIQQRQATAAAAVPDEPKQNTTNDLPLEENVNRLQIDGHSARNVDDAIHVLKSTQASVDSHPEKRMKAAYETFETENLPRLKQEHPTLRLSQLKQLMKKEWMKSPDNPFNKPTKAYNDTGNLKQNLPEEKDSDDEDN
ncbi:unnamed protein product [Adineta ricciae]|uniref:Coiled-coil domain-containing protein n=1 Tax=Adineta ricciae TaxID=249248 RepID=A0A813XA68_ADIRI|nr:unnamed protein product [Adineta ricciae]